MAGEADKPDAAAAETIFIAALPLSAAERAAYLLTACGNNLKLRQRVEALLRAHDAPEGFLPEQPARPPAATPTLQGFLAAQITEQPGDAIGRYKLREKLGEGGCGVVYMAEQEEPVRRKVALKVIKLGMDTKQVITRFEAERQALALMDHPNIARVLDAGATETGRPYFVMEPVGGIKITDYCEQNQLNTQQRLDLFIQVCRAIQHAHQKGIIHRDIKPSNVLVATQDGVPVPKVIDFGIAKATQGRLTDDTVFTAFEQFLGTPAYMSPEQAQVGGLDVDTRSDIYSLGVLLYELLTGRTPFDTKELLAAGLDAMRRTIKEKEPPTPSTRLKQHLAASSGGSDKSALSTLHSPLDKDLDWIVMKCLEKDRARRYETANGLATDIERHLTNEPVVAGPPSRLYRFQKLVRRNKITIAVAAAFILLLVVATGISVWQAVRATRAEALAKQRLGESEALSKFLSGLFQSPDPARDGRTITVAQTLDLAVRNLERDLTTEPARRAQLQYTLGKTYDALGLYPEAIALEEKVRDYSLTAWGPEHPVTLSVLTDLASCYANAGRLVEAVKMREQVLALRRKVNGLEHPDTLSAMHNAANSYGELGRLVEALKLREQVLPLRRKVNGPEHPDTLRAMGNLAISYADAGRLEDALKLREQVLPLWRKVLGPEHPEMLSAMNNLAISYHGVGRLDEARTLFEQVLALRQKVLGFEHPATLSTMWVLAVSYKDAGRWADALKLEEQVLPLSLKVCGPEHPDTLSAMNNLAVSYFELGRLDEALKLREEVLPLRRKINGPEHPDTLRAMYNLAESYSHAGRRDEGLRLLEELLQLRRKVLGPEHPDILATMLALADSYRGAGRPEEAVKLGQSSLEIYRRKSGPTHQDTLNAMTELAISCRVAGRTGEAIALEEESLRLKRQHLPPGHAMTVESIENLATCYEQSDMKPEAEALRRELSELKSKAATNSPAGPTNP